MRINARLWPLATAVAALLFAVHPAHSQPTAPYDPRGAARDVSPPPPQCIVRDGRGLSVLGCFASDSWVDKGKTPWAEERARRQGELDAYLRDGDPARAAKYGFKKGHTPALAWNWFSEHPIGYGGIPYVLLQTLLSIDPGNETDPNLRRLGEIWRKESVIEAEKGQKRYTLDHLGFGPHPDDYADGVAKDPLQRGHRLPNGLVYDPEVKVKEVSGLEWELKKLYWLPFITLIESTLRGKVDEHLQVPNYDRDRATYQQPPEVDAVFFACSACHQARVIVGGSLDVDGRMTARGRMQFMPGLPNTEVEARSYSQLQMETGLALLESGFSIGQVGMPKKKEDLKPKLAAIKALYLRMLQRARDPEVVKTIYGPQPDQVRRAMLQTYWVANDFTKYAGDLIGTAIKTQYVYMQVGARNAYHPVNQRTQHPGQALPDPIANRIGQMDAFGIASGLVAIHTYRADNSFLRFMCRDSKGQNPLFSILGTKPGPACDDAELTKAGQVIRDTIPLWAPPVPAPVDIPSLTWSAHRLLANWDGNQGAAARTLASGTSATGDPLKVNVRVHEPLNPLINNLPPAPYPFDISREKARRGMAIFNGDGLGADRCANCHRPYSDEVVPARHLGVDPNRAMVNTDVSRFALAGLVMEACRIFIGNNPGNDWCLPRDEQGRLVTDWKTANDDYFKDTPGRVRAGTHGYKVDMQHGIWGRAPYLHNGSVPTLGQLFCPPARPKKFLRGVLFYDQALVGFEWAVTPRERYSPHETQLVKEYDTAVFGRGNQGHTYGSGLCPDLKGLDPMADRREITRRILDSRVGDLIEYMKTF